MVLAINKIAKPGQRNFTIKSLARGFCGHRASPAKPKRRPPRISRRKITKVRLWLRELLFCTRRKIACCVFHLFWEKMHAISYSLFHWSEREISVAVLSLPSRRRRPGLNDGAIRLTLQRLAVPAQRRRPQVPAARGARAAGGGAQHQYSR